MKAINHGNIFEIYDDSLKTFDKLPAKTYIVRFNKMTGFYLESYENLEIKEDKIYGVHMKKVEKVIRTFDKFDRNLGIILSGNKGIGKSLFAKILGNEIVKIGCPLIIIDKFIPGIASYIESIDQEVAVLFDEFDKTFGNIKTSENEADPQAGLLSLFDGISHGKKMFIITCNELRNLNDFLINRPGRFHYHFRFDYPTASEIREYLQDKISEKYYGEITKVISFSEKVNLNYDCLRSIAFELENGEKFEDAITDLNIINLRADRYNISLHYTDGTILTSRNEMLDLFDPNDISYVYLTDNKNQDIVTVEFDASKCVFDSIRGCQVIYGKDVKISYDTGYPKEDIEHLKSLVPDCLIISKTKAQMMHYTV